MKTGTITSRPMVSAFAMFQVLTRRVVGTDDGADTDGAGCGTRGGSLRSVMGLP